MGGAREDLDASAPTRNELNGMCAASDALCARGPLFIPNFSRPAPQLARAIVLHWTHFCRRTLLHSPFASTLLVPVTPHFVPLPI